VTAPTPGDRSMTLQRGSRLGPYEIVSFPFEDVEVGRVTWLLRPREAS
jgi:hypothetical protein